MRASTDSPRACSGEKYCAVPITALVSASVAEESDTARAMPKSITFTWPLRAIMMLPGLMLAVDDASRGASTEGREHLLDDARRSSGGSGPGDEVAQQAPVDVLHDDEGDEALGPGRVRHRLLARVEDPHDRGVGHLRGVVGLAAEAGAERGIVGEARAQQLTATRRPSLRPCRRRRRPSRLADPLAELSDRRGRARPRPPRPPPILLVRSRLRPAGAVLVSLSAAS